MAPMRLTVSGFLMAETVNIEWVRLSASSVVKYKVFITSECGYVSTLTRKHCTCSLEIEPLKFSLAMFKMMKL